MRETPVILWRPHPIGPDRDERCTAATPRAAAAYVGCRVFDVLFAISEGSPIPGGFFADWADPRQVPADMRRAEASEVW